MSNLLVLIIANQFLTMALIIQDKFWKNTLVGVAMIGYIFLITLSLWKQS